MLALKVGTQEILIPSRLNLHQTLTNTDNGEANVESRESDNYLGNDRRTRHGTYHRTHYGAEPRIGDATPSIPTYSISMTCHDRYHSSWIS
jgi:hypothetical protein